LDFIEVRGERRQTPFCRAVTDGLDGRPKSLPTHYLYDQAGSELFERITDLPEYYPTRTERAILEQRAPEIVEAAGANHAMIEFGSGSSAKTRLLIEASLARQGRLNYAPIDISTDFLRSSSLALLDRYADLQITALGAEYFDAIEALPDHDGPRLILFLGSNIGNLTRDEAIDFLSRIRARMQPEDRMLLGVDQVKDREVLEAAYNDAQGVTAAFNRNLLCRVNRELDAKFPLESFRHHAPYDEREARIEMRLHAVGDLQVPIEALGRTYEFADGEFIHTEWSHKYTEASFGALAAPAGLQIDHTWYDEKGWFSLVMLRPTRSH
jgi:L-histidine N-alpha-methyltransferase